MRKKLIRIATLAAIIASGPALAAGTGEVEDVGVNAFNYEEVLPLVHGQNVRDLSGLTESDTIEVVAMSELAGASPENEALLDEAMTDRDPAALQEAVAANAVLTGALEAEDFTVEQVVAVAREEEGERYILYVDDRS